MQFGGHYLLTADRMAVWAALNDTDILGAAIPGCQRLDWTGPTTLELEIRVNLGIVQPVFMGDLILSDIVPAERYKLWGRGRGGLLGLAEGVADIVLSDTPHGTALTFTASAGASGQIMSFGKALIGKSAQRVIDGFFLRFGDAMGTTVTPVELEV